MPTTSTDEFVYANPTEVVEFVQTQPENFGLSTDSSSGDTAGVSEWQEFVESRQTEAKAHIDRFTGRDFEDHPADTVTLDGGETVVYAPSPIRDVQSVEADGDALTSGWTFKPSGVLIAESGFPPGYQNIEVVMDWGYEQPPDDVALAEKKLVDHNLVGMAQKREGMVVDAGDVSARINLPITMTNEVRQILDDYQRVRVTN